MKRRTHPNMMTTEEFDRYLAEAIDRDNPKPSDLLQVPGVYEVLSEHYNNAAIDAWQADEEPEPES